MKAHIGVDTASGLHTVVGTSANVSDINVAGALLRGAELAAFGDSGYQGVHKRAEAAGPTWHVSMRSGKRRLLNPFIEPEFVAERVEKMKATIRAKVEHPFGVIKRLFGFTKVRYRGLNTAQIVTLFALSNLWMARRMSASARPDRARQGRARLAPRSKSMPSLLDRVIWLRRHHHIHSTVIADRVLQTFLSTSRALQNRILRALVTMGPP